MPDHFEFRGKARPRLLDLGALPKGCVIQCDDPSNEVQLGRGARLDGLYIRFNGKGNKLVIGEDCRVAGRLNLDGDACSISIGSGTTVERVGMVAAHGRSITVGNDCMLSYDIEVRTTDAHAIFDIASRRRVNIDKSVVVGDHVWLCAGVMVTKGSQIESGCVVGARSVVSARTPRERNAVLAGNPVKVLRSGIVWSRINSDVFPQDMADLLAG